MATALKIQENLHELQNLEFVKLKFPRLIPRDLIENVKGRTFTPEQFYDYQTKLVGSPYNHLYVLIDTAKKIHGYLWAETNLLDGSLFVNTFSIKKQHWHKGIAIEMVIDFINDLKNEIKATHVFWMTTNKRFFEKKGFKGSKICLMHYNCN